MPHGLMGGFWTQVLILLDLKIDPLFNHGPVDEQRSGSTEEGIQFVIQERKLHRTYALIEYVKGEFSGLYKKRIDHHLQVCVECRDELAELEEIIPEIDRYMKEILEDLDQSDQDHSPGRIYS